MLLAYLHMAKQNHLHIVQILTIEKKFDNQKKFIAKKNHLIFSKPQNDQNIIELGDYGRVLFLFFVFSVLFSPFYSHEPIV